MELGTSSSRKRQRREVVSEEEYTSTLSTIIQRDYYSDLPELQLQSALLNRRSAGDFEGAVRVRRAARKLKNHEEALMEEELIAEEELVDGIRSKARPLHRESLTGFHSRVTSEDNVEFERTQEAEVRANRERLEALFQSAHQQQQLLLKESGEEDYKRSALASDEFNPPPSRIDFSERKQPAARNGLFFVPTPASSSGGGNSKASLFLKNETDNNHSSLMPPPPSRTNTMECTSNTEGSKHELVQYIPKHKFEKRTVPSQTRFAKSIATFLRPAIEDSTNDSVAEYSTDASTDLDSDGHSIEVERQGRLRRQKREQQTFVNMTPLVVPVAGNGLPGRKSIGFSVEASPIVTWGTIEGTPLVIRPVNSSSEERESQSAEQSEFVLAEENKREKAAREVQMALEKRRARANGKSGDARSLSRKKTSAVVNPYSIRQLDPASFSPAAMKLLEKTSKQRNSSSARSSTAFASSLRLSYTPQRTGGCNSVSRLRNSSAWRKEHAYGETPRLISGGRVDKSDGTKNTIATKESVAARRKSQNITDGLLKLP